MVKNLKYLFLLSTLLLITNVNASTVNGNEADSPVYAVVSSNYNNAPVRIWTNNIFGSSLVDYGTVVNDYVYVTGCTDMPTIGYSYSPFYNNTTGHSASATDIRYTANLTSKTCSFSNGSHGKVAYIKFRLISDLLNVPTSGDDTWLYNGYITLNIGTYQAFSFSIQNISVLDSDLDIYSNDFDTSLLEQQNQQIINNQNSNTNSIINNQDRNTQNIIDNQNQNKQDIINNQNANTEKEIESQKVCNTYDNSSVFEKKHQLEIDGTTSYTSFYGITDYIRLNSRSELKMITDFPFTSSSSLCYYNVNKSLISCIKNNDLTQNSLISLPNNVEFVRFSIRTEANKPQFQICNNGNQAVNDSINNLNDTLNDTSQPNTNQDIQDMDDMVASDTPISDLITMPLTLVNAYINGINSTCSPVNLGNLYGTNLTLPCINLQQRLGSNLWSKIDILFCIFMCYNIGMLFVSAFDGITSLRDDFESLYQPRHADVGYQPRHGGGN